MANGRPGDHPLSDILNHGYEVYGKETDDLIRKIAELMPRRELSDWWMESICSDTDKDHVREEVQKKYRELYPGE